ncbi:uncharacterized protein [Dysidea avara]|uniref:uncharacterized protein n=1 Tax=Dysidea avara TaxID=196820 RepID=UPI00331687E1
MYIVTWLVVVLGATQFAFATDTVPELQFARYVGRWYEVYADRYSNMIHGKCMCALTDIGPRSNDSVTIQNFCRLKSPDGKLSTIKGYIIRPDDKEQGKLKLHLSGNPVGMNYWVIQLGPPTYNGSLYQYHVITDGSDRNMFVMVRNVTLFKEKFEATVLQKLEQQGFNKSYNKPVAEYQGNDCQYP